MAKSKKVVPINPLAEVANDINKKHGAGSVMFMGDAPNQHVVASPSGLLALDLALGVGGLPKGRVFELFGVEGGGKTTLALTMIAATQKAGGACAYIDAEHGLDTTYAEKLGVDTDKMLINQPDDGETGLDILMDIVKTGKCAMVVVDSVAALIPKEELEGGIADRHMALQARMMGAAVRKLNSIASKSNTIVIFINQLRSTMATSQYAKQQDTPGGKALKYGASVRLDVRRSDSVVDKNKNILGHHVVVSVVKNRVAPPFRKANAVLMFDKGFDAAFDVLEAGIKSGIIEQSGASYAFGDAKLGYGKDNVLGALRDDPALMTDLTDAIAANIKLPRKASDLRLAENIDKETGEVADASE